MTPLPDSFPSPLHLPFNGACLQGKFSLSAPACDPGEAGLLLLLQGSELVVTESLRLPEGERAAELLPAMADPLFIGTWEGKPCRVLMLPKEHPLPVGFTTESLLAAEPALSIELLTLGGMAGQILHWERGGRFCSRCGGEMDRITGEWGKQCRGCGYAHYPHIHPCVIVLARRAGEVLLTRKSIWPPGRYSLVAGFLDFGECLEEAVVREVLEETGVLVDNLRYVGSQSWPFPSQLMAGFTAEYVSGEVRVEEKELEDARWFAVDALPVLPPKRSIARYILDNHLDAQDAAGREV
jgi:NAD+ diphosphatase